jgi:hypothetical protein
MNIELQVLDNQSRAIPAGTLFTLLGNGEPLATGSTDARGVVTFSLDKQWTEGLSVRLAGLPPADGFPPKLEIKRR